MRPFLLLVIPSLALSVVCRSYSQESGADKLSKLLFIHSVEVEEAEKPYREEIAELNDNYVKALERQAEKAQSAGQLEDLLAIRKEIEHVKRNGAPGTDNYPGHVGLRGKYGEAVTLFAKQNTIALASTIERHIGELKELKVELTKAGELEAAVEATRRIASLKGSPDDPGATPVVPGKSSLDFSTVKMNTSPLHGADRFYGEAKLEPGIYEFPGDVIIGGGQVDENEGHVEIPPGTTILGGKFLVDEGSTTAERALFSEVDLQADLGASFTATDCLFDRGRQRKGGVWTTKYYSAKWTFENCVFFQSFPDLSVARHNGIKMTDCTIIEANIGTAEYYESPVEESHHEWRQVERCHFIDCTLSVTFLIMTEDCVFENCTFVPDLDTISPEKSKRITLYFKGPKSDLPPESPRIVFKRAFNTDLRKEVGSSLKHDF